MTELQHCLDRLARLYPKGIDLSLDRLRTLLAKLGDPHRQLPPIIHVAGTNGKGSVVAYTRAVLEAAGYLVHTYTSPHLVRFNERFRLGANGGGQLVTDRVLLKALLKVEKANAKEPLTLFEATTAAGFILFAQYPADYLIMEVGLGGRFDTTNIVDKTILSFITMISYDHKEFLGDTLARIAYEKAGILRPGTPAVILKQSRQALTVIKQVAGEINAPLLIEDIDWDFRPENGGMTVSTTNYVVDLPKPKLLGFHQLNNAGAAIVGIKRIIPDIDYNSLVKGLSNVDWPARMQNISNCLLADALAPGTEIWLDGGHNPAAGRAIAQVVADMEEKNPLPLIMIVGMMANKDHGGFIKCFKDLANSVYSVAIPQQANSVDADKLRDIAADNGLIAYAAQDIKQALSMISKRHGKARILICGSLYLAGYVLQLADMT